MGLYLRTNRLQKLLSGTTEHTVTGLTYRSVDFLTVRFS